MLVSGLWIKRSFDSLEHTNFYSRLIKFILKSRDSFISIGVDTPPYVRCLMLSVFEYIIENLQTNPANFK